jgi:hypothetical protein
MEAQRATMQDLRVAPLPLQLVQQLILQLLVSVELDKLPVLLPQSCKVVQEQLRLPVAR